jgi:hypothetical protein
MKVLAEANYCEYWTQEERYEAVSSGRITYKKRHKVLGRVANTTAVLVMFDYLYATVMRLLPYDKTTWFSKDAIAWCDGCVDRLAIRIAAKAEAMRTPDYAAQGETGYTTAIQVADLVNREAAANYDFRNGEGAWAKKLARQTESDTYWSAEAMAEREVARAAALAAKRALETPEQKSKRERAEAKEATKDAKWRERYWERQERKEEREAARKASSAYRSGSVAGQSIGLDSQVSEGQRQGALVN